MAGCQIEDCGKGVHKDGLCEEHYLMREKGGKSTLTLEYAMHVGFLVGGRVLNQMLTWYDQLFTLKEQDLVLVHKNLAKHYRKKGDVIKAIQSLKKVVELEPTAENNELRVMLGEFYVLNGNLDDAKITFLTALKNDSASVEASVGLAGVYQRENDLDNAAKYFEQARKLGPNNHRVLYELAVLYDKKKEPTKAIDCLKSAIEASPDTVKYHQYLGFMYEAAGAHAEAIPHFKKVLELEHARSA